MPSEQAARTIFNDMAALYDEVRPGYPEQLIEDTLALSQIPPGGQILEIGCGPGTATVPFPRRGYTMLCLELGAELARLAHENCRSYPRVTIRNSSFEEWTLQAHTFDLAICAEAFHWLAPETRLVKTAAALKHAGSFALLWHGHHIGKGSLFQALGQVYREHVPELLNQLNEPMEELEQETLKEIEDAGVFAHVSIRRYPWQETYTTERYIKLLRTYAPIHRLAEAARQHVLDDIHALIEQHGGRVEKPIPHPAVSC